MINATNKSLCRSTLARCRSLLCNVASAYPAAVRCASLSAIHRGLRQSNRAQFGQPRHSNNPTHDKSSRGADRLDWTAKALNGASSGRQQHKLRKKLDRKTLAMDEDDVGRQTRRKRFLDPNSSFGKRSLVYQLKHGSLKDTAASLNLQEPVRPRQFPSNDHEPRHHGNDESQSFEQRFDGELRYNNSQGYNNNSIADAPARSKKRIMMPMTITYTTAASQFLYGKSVVKAALEQGKRQIYKLYVYESENRRDSKDREFLITLAKSRGVAVTIVQNEDQRLMDKMSMGRPHNGFVLETSPLPQLPITSLGQLEESSSKLGFHVELDHQTAEQRSINGQDTFVRKTRNSTAKPFVLLLHEILDPGNLGGMLRTASYMGVDAVAITSRGSSNLTPIVLKSAAGGAEEVTIFTVNSPVEFLQHSRSRGWKTYSAVAPPEHKLVKLHSDKFICIEDIEQSRPLDQHPCILVLGNEGHGLPRPIKVATDFELSVPKFVKGSSVDSLNVSVAAGLLCHSFVKESNTNFYKKAGAPTQMAVLSKIADSTDSDDRLF